MEEKPRLWLAGFFLLGILLGLLGSLVVVWRYQIDVEPHLIGLHFLAVNAGYVIAAAICGRLLRKIPPRSVALAGCALAALGLVSLALAEPPASSRWRLGALVFLGLAAGSLGTALLYAFEGLFRTTSIRGAFRAALLFGLGCLAVTIVCGSTYFLGSAQTAMLLLALISCLYLVLFLRTRGGTTIAAAQHESDLLHETLSDLRSIATVLFSLLVFVQFGNEWAIAGWLPLFLIHRLGSNPALAIAVLAAYFLALTLVRVAAARALPFISRRRLLIASIALSVCGFALLEMARSLTTATFAVLVIGAGFAPIYPLISEQLDQRFSYHPGFYNGMISIAITGAMSAPWLLGFLAASFGMGYVMLLPAIGSIVVLVLALLLMFEAHLMREKTPG